MLERFSNSVLSIDCDDSDVRTDSFIILLGYAHSIVLHFDCLQAIVFKTNLYVREGAIRFYFILFFGDLTMIKRQTNRRSLRIQTILH